MFVWTVLYWASGHTYSLSVPSHVEQSLWLYISCYTCWHGDRSPSQGAWTKLKDTLATRCIVLPHDCFSWQPRQQKQRNEGVSSPDCQTWHRESSGPGRRPCPGGWGCYPSSRSLSRTEPLPPEDRPLWSEETQTQIQTRGGDECFVAGQSDWTVLYVS